MGADAVPAILGLLDVRAARRPMIELMATYHKILIALFCTR